MNFRDHCFVVTGAGSGIGRELALQLLARGSKVAAVDIRPEALDSLTAEFPDGARLRAFVADVGERSQVEMLATEIAGQMGSIDGLINNAGVIQPFLPMLELTVEQIERVLRINLHGVIYMCRAFIPHLLHRPISALVNVSSMGGFLPVPTQTVYCAAKAGVHLMTEGLAAELAGTPVRVSVVFPGAVATNIQANSGASRLQVGAEKSKPKPLTASTAARQILDGVERGTRRIYVGKDSSIMSLLNRMSPTFAANLIARTLGH